MFAAESKIAGDNEQMADVLTRYKLETGTLPPGLNLRILLDEPIGAKTARVGNTINARLESSVRVSSDSTIPKGSLLRGRIRQFERLDDSPNTFRVGLAFSELEASEKTYRFFAEIVGMEPLPGVESEILNSLETEVDLRVGRLKTTRTEVIPADNIPGAAVFFLNNTTTIPKGFRMTWRTQKVGN